MSRLSWATKNGTKRPKRSKMTAHQQEGTGEEVRPSDQGHLHFCVVRRGTLLLFRRDGGGALRPCKTSGTKRMQAAAGEDSKARLRCRTRMITSC